MGGSMTRLFGKIVGRIRDGAFDSIDRNVRNLQGAGEIVESQREILSSKNNL